MIVLSEKLYQDLRNHVESNGSGDEKSDYTKWRQRYFDNVTSDEFQAAAVAYAKENPL